MNKIFAVILILALLLPGAAIAQDALPYLAVGVRSCQTDSQVRWYGNIWTITSLSSQKQHVEMIIVYPDGYKETFLNRSLMSGEQFTFNEWNKPEYAPPSYYTFRTYDENNFLNGEQSYTTPHCSDRIFIPKVEGKNVATE